MFTKEQIKNLKKGDKVLAEVEVFAITESGQLMLKSLDEWTLDQTYPLPTPPKYDPTRLFKKGDVVTPSSFLGRKDKELEMGEKYIVTADEIAGDMVAIKHHFTLRPDIVQPCFLELVTPVEKMGPYKVEKKPGHYIVYYQDQDKDGMTGQMYLRAVFFFGHPKKYTEDEALAAAEDECERLTEEWKKGAEQ